jgi:hypothetical protein
MSNNKAYVGGLAAFGAALVALFLALAHLVGGGA